MTSLNLRSGGICTCAQQPPPVTTAAIRTVSKWGISSQHRLPASSGSSASLTCPQFSHILYWVIPIVFNLSDSSISQWSPFGPSRAVVCLCLLSRSSTTLKTGRTAYHLYHWLSKLPKQTFLAGLISKRWLKQTESFLPGSYIYHTNLSA